MKIVPAGFVKKWQERIVNLHPSLLPAYPGLDSIQRAHADRAAIGLTVHKVNERVDDGEVICQRKTVNAELADTLNLALAEFLVHVDEQRVIKEAIRRWKELRIS
jgi:phosphoribosylglycinamide formyltransferase-1